MHTCLWSECSKYYFWLKRLFQGNLIYIERRLRFKFIWLTVWLQNDFVEEWLNLCLLTIYNTLIRINTRTFYRVKNFRQCTQNSGHKNFKNATSICSDPDGSFYASDLCIGPRCIRFYISWGSEIGIAKCSKKLQ